MARFLLFLMTMLAAAAATLSLQSCKTPPPQPEPVGPTTDLIILPDGATMIARSGSPERALAEWIGRREGEETGVALSDAMFSPDRTALSPAALGRTARFADILKTAPDTRIELRADETGGLAARRAEQLGRFLEERGIVKARISLAGGDHEPPQSNGLELVVRRHPASEPALAPRPKP